MSSISSAAAGGLAFNYARVAESANRVAVGGVQDRLAPAADRPEPRIDVTQALVDARQAELGYTANAKVFGVAAAMQDTTIRMLG